MEREVEANPETKYKDRETRKAKANRIDSKDMKRRKIR
jgi:hypothetical protein